MSTTKPKTERSARYPAATGPVIAAMSNAGEEASTATATNVAAPMMSTPVRIALRIFGFSIVTLGVSFGKMDVLRVFLSLVDERWDPLEGEA